MTQAQQDQMFMKEALALARQAGEMGEVPIGCVITRDGEIVGRWPQPAGDRQARRRGPCSLPVS